MLKSNDLTFTSSNLDVLVSNLFSLTDTWKPVTFAESISYPLNLYEDTSKDGGLVIELACVGVEQDRLEITTKGDTLTMKYLKPDDDNDDDSRRWLKRSIVQRSFNIGYRVSSKYDISKIEASLDNGLLRVFIPFTEKSKPKTVKLKTK